MRKQKEIYAIQHEATKRVYIGISKNAKNRYLAHMYALRAGRHAVEDMQDDYDKYGEEYSLYILEKVEYEDYDREYEWMEKYKSYIRGIGYNYNDAGFRRNQVPQTIPLKNGLPEINF